MIFLGKITSMVAQQLVWRDWLLLKTRLKTILSEHLRSNDRPNELAQKLLISGEDHRFFRHYGVDFIAIARALWRRIVWGQREGASTIEMQTVRILTGRYERTLRRKLKEILLATLISRVIPKDELPAIHLRIAYFGWKMNGFKQACQRLTVSPSAMPLHQAAALVARLKYPEPRVPSPERVQDISNRCSHLQMLYSKHWEQTAYSSLWRRVHHATFHNL